MIVNDSYALDKRVVLQHRTGATTGLNEQMPGAWANVLPNDGKLWASVVDLSGNQYIAAGGKQNAVHTQIKIRHRAGVTASMRVLCGGVAYDIEAVLERDRHWLFLMCSRGESDG